jgi:hypothetical protein
MIQTGVVGLGQDSAGDRNLSTGSGMGEFQSVDIPFDPRFPAPPTVVLALSGIDSDHVTNVRVELYPQDVQREEFNIVVRTWDDTALYSATVTGSPTTDETVTAEFSAAA